MPSFSGGVDVNYWFDPMALMLAETAPDDPRYVWWSGVLGTTLGLNLINMVTFCSQPPPAYPPLNQESFDALGLEQVFRMWLGEVLYTKYTIP